MKTFFISDTHFNHRRIIEYCGRPYKDVDEMNNKIVNNWNSVVGAEDIVYHLGDFCLGDREVIRKFVARLNGRKMIILGNHDKYRPSEYMELGFEWASRMPIIYADFVILSHEPAFLEANSPYCNLYGHTHQNKYISPNKNYFNVCVEQINYTPIERKEIEKYFESVGIKND